MKFQAHYKSPLTDHPVNGVFEFHSEARINTKQNKTDARIKMLELFGNEALSWEIDKVAKSVDKVSTEPDAVQLGLDFREPKKVRRHHKFERGRV